MTLRESLQSEIASAEAALADKRAQLAALESQGAAWLDHEVEVVRAFFNAIKAHFA